MRSFLETMTSKQLNSLYWKMYGHYTKGDHFGGDWITLKLTDPVAHDVMRNIVAILNERQNAANEFENIPS